MPAGMGMGMGIGIAIAIGIAIGIFMDAGERIAACMPASDADMLEQ
jgi:hypothetical protein